MMNSQLVIFDIDGTLTATNEVDDECYCQAVADALRLTPREIAWTEAPHVTDGGIAHWLWMRHRHRAPTTQELSAVKKQFLQLLEAELIATPDRFVPPASHIPICRSLVLIRWRGKGLLQEDASAVMATR